MNSPAVHVRDNGNGTVRARVMFKPNETWVDFRADNFLNAALSLLAERFPDTEFRKTGWSANTGEAIYHFAAIAKAVQP